MLSASRPAKRSPVLLPLAVAVAVGVGAFVCMRLILEYVTYPHGTGVLWWPLAAAVVAVVVRCPRSWWPVIIVGYTVGETFASIGNPWSLTVTYLLVNAIEVIVAVLVLSDRRDPTNRRLHAPRDAVRFAAASVAAVAFGVGVIALSEVLFPSDADFYDLPSYLVTHLLGFLSVAPLLLPGPLGRRWTLWSAAEFVAVLLAIFAVFWWTFWPIGISGRAFIFLLPVIWAAVRFDSIRATAVAVFVCALAAYATADGRGPFAAPPFRYERQLLIELFIFAVTATATGLILVTRHRQQLATQARDSEQTQRAAIRDALNGIYSIRLEEGHLGEIRDVNTALCTMLGYRPEQLIGQYCGMLGARSTPNSRATLEKHLRDFAAGERQVLREESTFYTVDNEPRWVELNLSTVDSVGEPKFILAQVHDLTDRERSKQELEKMALRDALTHLANRTLLFRCINDELVAAQANSSRIGLLFLDLDGFKEVNDTHGHAAGDAVLVAVAGRLTGAVRAGATVARLGGDEFAIVCPDTRSVDELQEIAIRLRRLVQEPISISDGTLVSIDVSIGASVMDGDGSADALIREADRAMYRIKDARRVR